MSAPRRIRTIIVDDEPPARELIATLLRDEPDVDVVFQGCCEPAARAIEDLSPDLVFLDVQMPGLDGFDILATARPPKPPIVVFVTAYDQYALKAFEVHAFDYILKPFEYDRVRQTLVRVRERLGERSPADFEERLAGLLGDATARAGGWERIAVRDGRKVRFVKPAEIDRVESDGNYVRLFLGKTSMLHRETMHSVEERLRRHGFVRVSRSAMVSIDRIREWQPLFHGDSLLILADGARVQVSRTYRRALEERIGTSGSSLAAGD